MTPKTNARVRSFFVVALSTFLILAAQGGTPDNTAVGGGALNATTTGTANTATGYQALTHNTIGSYNTATGELALTNNINGNHNTADGWRALMTNSSGNYNTAIGEYALKDNGNGDYNTAVGFQALELNTAGHHNTATGVDALEHNTGNFNTANGYQALLNITVGDKNTAAGYQALSALKKGDFNIGVGNDAGSTLITGNNNIYIGSPAGVQSETGSIRIGVKGTHAKTFVAAIYNNPIANAQPVWIDANGQLGAPTSSARFKKDIKPMGETSHTILGLNPVTFHYKNDDQNTEQFGLVAEDVERVSSELVVHDESGKPLSVRYDAVNAMLLNEFLKEHKQVQEQQATIAELKSAMAKQDTTLARQQKSMEILAADLAKLSRQAEVARPVDGIVDYRSKTAHRKKRS